MNILIIGENNFNSLERIYKKNFLNLNCKSVNIVEFINPKNNILKKILNFLEKYHYFFYCLTQNYLLKRKIKYQNIQYDLIIVFNGYHLNYDMISYLKKKTSKSLINIQTDNIFIKKNILKKNINYFDKIYVWSKKIKIKINKELNIKKNKIYFLPFGFDQTLVIKRKKISINNKILFYGSWDKQRENILNHINPTILKIYGNGWYRAKKSFKNNYKIKRELIGKKLVTEISKSLLCLNLFRPQAKNYINMRSFEVLGYNGTLLSEYSKEQDYFFSRNKNIIYFNNFKKINNIFDQIILKKKLLIKNRNLNKFKINKNTYLNRAKIILKNEKNLLTK